MILHLRLHIAHLHRRCMRTEHKSRFALYEKSVLHVARRMVFGDVQHVKVVPLAFEERPFFERKAHSLKNSVRFADEARYRVYVTALHRVSIPGSECGRQSFLHFKNPASEVVPFEGLSQRVGARVSARSAGRDSDPRRVQPASVLTSLGINAKFCYNPSSLNYG